MKTNYETVKETLSNGNTFEYKIVNGTFYHVETPEEVVRICEQSRQFDIKYKFYYGDVETGRDWCEENDTIGIVGRSTGRIKIPLLITSSRSIGGGGLMDDRVLKIVDMKTKRVMYQHPLYVAPIVEIEFDSDGRGNHYMTIVNGELHGRHKSLKSAQICKSKIA